MQSLGKLITGVGFLLIIVGLLMWFSSDKLNWLGNLPGDIKVEREKFRFYAPIATMLILSLILSFVLWVIGRFFK